VFASKSRACLDRGAQPAQARNAMDSASADALVAAFKAFAADASANGLGKIRFADRIGGIKVRDTLEILARAERAALAPELGGDSP